MRCILLVVVMMSATMGRQAQAQSEPQEQKRQRQELIRAPEKPFAELNAGLPQVARYCNDDSFSLDRLAKDVAPNAFSWDTSSIAWELGLKVRMPPRRGFYPAIRMGYRFNGLQEITRQRLVVEFGTGVW